MTWLIGGTLLTALSEWIMVELVRTPYRPPSDMLTLLGTEKYGLVAIMIGLAAIWLIFVVVFLTRNRVTITNYLAFTAVVAAILTFIGYIISHPHRDVTPWTLMVLTHTRDNNSLHFQIPPTQFCLELNYDLRKPSL